MKNYDGSRRFLVDFMLGRLCRWLRLLGEDAAYFSDRDKSGILYRSLKERRVILTRDSNLAVRKAYGLYLVSSVDFREQLTDVTGKFSIEISQEKIYTRCTECNSMLEPVEKSAVKEKVPEYVYNTQELFSVCPVSGKVYWRGTHRELINEVLSYLNRRGEQGGGRDD